MALNPMLKKLVEQSSQRQYWDAVAVELKAELERRHHDVAQLPRELKAAKVKLKVAKAEAARLKIEWLAAEQAFEHTRAELDYAELMRNEADEKAA